MKIRQAAATLCSIIVLCAGIVFGAPSESPTFDVNRFGAVNDGSALSTEAINRAVAECSTSGGGKVLFPAGTYLSGTVRLKSGVHLYFEAGARLVGTTNLSLYQYPEVPSFMPEAKWGKWHRALILGQDVENVSIGGPGVVDGNEVYDPTGEERMRGPHAIVLVNCRKFEMRDITILDAANYGIFFQVSDEVDIRNVSFIGGWDGVHFRGAPTRWCRKVNITGCRFFTGDDSIAGRYWEDTVISDCIINSSCNGIRLIGPAVRLLVSDCLFYGPGERPHRSSSRTNMLSGIILQPGAWDKTEGLLDEVFIADNTMRDVASPVTIWTKPGNPVGKVTIAGLNATGVYRSAVSIESWSDLPITNVILRDVQVEFAGGGGTELANREVKGPGVDARPLPAWGLYTRNVESVTLEDVRFSFAREDRRPVVRAESTHRLVLDNFRYSTLPQVQAISTNGVAELVVR